MEVWGVGTTRTMRVHWLLRECGMTYVTHPIGSRTGETQTAEYLALNPRGKIPTLRHGELVLTESAAILSYLVECLPLPDDFFVPDNAGARARLAEWCYFAMTELDAHSLYVVRRHGDLAHLYGAAPRVVESAKEYFLKQLNATAPRIAAADPYLMGAFSIADIILMTCTDWAEARGVTLPEVVLPWRDRVAARPVYRDTMQFNYGKTAFGGKE